ncbi:MAG: TlpA family protein disulfide reductase [Fibrobacterota bacterium]|nr:TlpA family protein disulfide reductase [Fibrobacterota bacterium]QQS03640.1 MAG: TlpA family protein disulfide reductase [Fibrobacterota bacterium]
MNEWKSLLLGACIFAGILPSAAGGAVLNEVGKNKVGAEFPNRIGIDLSRPGTELISPLDRFEDKSVKHVFLSFFQTTCVPCLAELSQISMHNGRLRKGGVEVFLVAVQEEPAEIRKFLKTNRYDFPTIADRFEAEYSHRCGVFGVDEVRKLPTSVLLGKSADGGLVLEAVWQGSEENIVDRILEKAK